MFELYIRVMGTLRWIGSYPSYAEAWQRSRTACEKTPGHEGWEIFEPEGA